MGKFSPQLIFRSLGSSQMCHDFVWLPLYVVVVTTFSGMTECVWRNAKKCKGYISHQLLDEGDIHHHLPLLQLCTIPSNRKLNAATLWKAWVQVLVDEQLAGLWEVDRLWSDAAVCKWFPMGSLAAFLFILVITMSAVIIIFSFVLCLIEMLS